MDCTIYKIGNVSDEVVQAAIEMMEYEEGKRVIEITVRQTDVPDVYSITPVFEKIPFQRIRRITGYLVGDLGRFNNAKAQEVKDRVKHGT